MKIHEGKLPNRDAREDEFVGIDIEMYQQVKPLHLPTGTFACISICMGDDVWVIFETDDAREALKRVRKGKWALHNAMYDISHLRRYMEIKERPIWDTFLVEKHLFGGLFSYTFGLKDLARRWLNVYRSKETRDEFAEAVTMTKEMIRYAALDAHDTRRIAEKQDQYIRDYGIPMQSYLEVNGPAIWTFLDMNYVRVDKDMWLKASKELQARGEKIVEELGFNVNSPVQTKDFLNEYLDLRRPLTNTRADTLKKYGGEPFTPDDGDPVVKSIMEARSLLKMGSTYGESFLETVNDDGYILPGWKIDGPVTGRGACADPNFQNVPVREFPIFRQAVIPSDGREFLVSDASSQEPRIGAQLTQDPALLKALKSDESFYVAIALEIIHEKIKKGTKRYGEIKSTVLGSFYGLTPSGLANREGISRAAATQLQDAFFAKFGRVPVWMRDQRQMVVDRGYIETPLRRRIGINYHDRQWPNHAVNYPIQGGAGEQTKLSMNLLRDGCNAAGIPYRVVLQVHDEIDSDVEKEYLKKYKAIKEEAWMQAGKRVTPDVPLEIEMESGSSWGAK